MGFCYGKEAEQSALSTVLGALLLEVKDPAASSRASNLQRCKHAHLARCTREQIILHAGGVMYQFFAEPSNVGEKDIYIRGTDVNHMRNVLRMRPGEQVCVHDGASGREYRCEISEYLENAVHLKIMWVEEADKELPSRIYLFQGLPKGDKMELVIQKAVELGAYEIVPVATKRAVVRLDEKKAAAKQKRWQSIAESAAKQCKRNVIPGVHAVMKFEDAVSYAKNLDVVLIPYEMAKGMDATKKIIQAIRPGQSVGIFIGPEGGFDENEVALAGEAGIRPITLGKRILRTETAGMTVLSVLMFHLESAEAFDRVT